MPWMFNPFTGTFDFYQSGGTTTPAPGDNVDNLVLASGENLLIDTDSVLLV